MKRICSFVLALLACLMLVLPASAVEQYQQITFTAGNGASLVFKEAVEQTHTVLISAQSWSSGGVSATNAPAARTDIRLLVLKQGCTVTRSGESAPLTVSFLTRSGEGYVESADRLTLHAVSFNADTLFSYPFVKADLCRIAMTDGTEIFLMPAGAAVLEAPPVAISYTVRRGDSLDMIAMNYYGAQGLGAALREANPEHFEATGGILEAGRALTLPTVLNGVPRLSEPLAKENELLYVVKPNDTLGAIAAKYYNGRSDLYNYIYQRNADRMKNPGILTIGMVLVLPVIPNA